MIGFSHASTPAAADQSLPARACLPSILPQVAQSERLIQTGPTEHTFCVCKLCPVRIRTKTATKIVTLVTLKAKLSKLK
jgi:hypothetical protein